MKKENFPKFLLHTDMYTNITSESYFYTILTENHILNNQSFSLQVPKKQYNQVYNFHDYQKKTYDTSDNNQELIYLV